MIVKSMNRLTNISNRSCFFQKKKKKNTEALQNRMKRVFFETLTSSGIPVESRGLSNKIKYYIESFQIFYFYR